MYAHVSRSVLSLLTFCNSNSGANLIVPDLMPVTQGSKVDVFKEIYLMITFTDGMKTDRLTDCFKTTYHNLGCDIACPDWTAPENVSLWR
jgi:hypothetical protein